MKYQIIDDFLKLEDLSTLNDQISAGKNFDWYYWPNIAFIEDNSSSTGYFTHTFYDARRDEGTPVYSGFFKYIVPLLDLLSVSKLIRAKVNLYPKTCTIEEHNPHCDLPYSHKGCILYLNTCNGYTTIENQKILSIANRVLLFDASMLHHSSSCSDQKFRMTLNVNYF